MSQSIFADGIPPYEGLPPNQVPVEVQSSIMKNFKEIKDLTWGKDGNEYMAEFKIGIKEYSVFMNDKGEIISTYEDITIEEVPANVIKSVQANYSNYKIKSVKFIKAGKSNYYKLNITDSVYDKEIFINSNGEIVKAPIIEK